MEITLGCQNRPWSEYSLEEALSGIAAAGYSIVGFTPQQGKPVFSAESSEEEIERFEALLDSHGLEPQMAIRQPNLWEMEEAEAVAAFQKEIALGSDLGLEYFILTGISDESKYEAWYSAVGQCLDCAEENDVMLLLKPHGGLCALAEDLLGAVERFAHPNFGICYDPGNILYYTGERPEDDLPKLVEHVQAMCVKDETGGQHGEVMLTPGDGLVDFRRIFSILDEAGFEGPCWIECLGGGSVAEINTEAVRARRFLLELAAEI